MFGSRSRLVGSIGALCFRVFLRFLPASLLDVVDNGIGRERSGDGGGGDRGDDDGGRGRNGGMGSNGGSGRLWYGRNGNIGFEGIDGERTRNDRTGWRKLFGYNIHLIPWNPRWSGWSEHRV